MAETDDILAEGKRQFQLAQDAENDNRICGEEDIRFARHEEQWPLNIYNQRVKDGRPVLTISKMNSFIRQVVNDARQNKPSIKVHPADSNADPETAEVIGGLIRNIEYSSNADVAYDTAIESAVAGGFGYWRIAVDYAYHDSFDKDLIIKRVANPFSIYGDPNSVEADSSDWMSAFVIDRLTKGQFEARYGKTKTITDWEDTSWGAGDWREGEDVTVAEWWTRTETDIKVQQFLNTNNQQVQTYTEEGIASSEDLQFAIANGFLQFKRERMAKTFKVKQQFMTGAELLEDPTDWAGCYIPIVPVYGDEYNIKGKRYFRSLIHSAKDAQRQFNYWRSTATELVALAPRVPFIGPKGAFDHDQERWNTVNTQSHAYLEYQGGIPPQRMPLDSGPAAGALQEALNASDDMKAVIGLYDASLGARSNETSGRAIMARQREGDVSTFHFTDNLNRAIRHTGRILIDLIPHVYSGERIIRVMGEDGKPENKPLGKEYPKVDPKTGQPIMQPVMGEDGQPVKDEQGNEIMQAVMAMHDLSAGKYDLTVTTGPNFTTRREEAAYSMTEALRAMPAAAPVILPELAKNLDWPGADDIAEKLEKLNEPAAIPPELQQQIEQGKQKLVEQEQTIQQLKTDQAANMAKIDADKQQAATKLQADEEIEREKIASNERIAFVKIASERKMAEYRAQLSVQQTQAPAGYQNA